MSEPLRTSHEGKQLPKEIQSPRAATTPHSLSFSFEAEELAKEYHAAMGMSELENLPDLPPVVKELSQKYGDAMGLAGDAVAVIRFAVTILELAGVIDSDRDVILREIDSVKEKVEREIRRVLDRLNQIEYVELVGPVNAQIQNLRDFTASDDVARNAIGANIITQTNTNHSKLQIAISQARGRHDWERAVMFTKSLIENHLHRKTLKEEDSKRTRNEGIPGSGPAFGALEVSAQEYKSLATEFHASLTERQQELFPYIFEYYPEGGGNIYTSVRWIAKYQLPERVPLPPPPTGGIRFQTSVIIWTHLGSLSGEAIQAKRRETQDRYQAIITELVAENDTMKELREQIPDL